MCAALIKKNRCTASEDATPQGELASHAVLEFPIKSRPAAHPPQPLFVARSGIMRGVLDRIRRVAQSRLTALVSGETGTGKELVATLLHVGSPRADGPLVRFNCGAIPRELVESELFGHVRGSFTGAVASRRGYFGLADGGTLVLDEIETLPLDAQPKLLRALEDGEVQVVGAGKPDRVDVRVVACTNRDLMREVQAGRFRQDLYYRLAIVPVEIPPLRDHSDDILPLFEHFLTQHRSLVTPIHVTSEMLQVLPTLPWPGNVRQLRNAVTAMLALSEDGMLDTRLLHSVIGPTPMDTAAIPAQDGPRGWLKAQVATFERSVIERTLVSCNHNRSKTARRLGISRTTLIDLIRRHKIEATAV